MPFQMSEGNSINRELAVVFYNTLNLAPTRSPDYWNFWSPMPSDVGHLATLAAMTKGLEEVRDGQQ